MGNTILEHKTRKIAEDNQSIQNALTFIFNFQQPFSKRLDLEKNLAIINNQIFQKSVIMTMQSDKIFINNIFLKIWYTKKSQVILKKIFDYWLKQHHRICRKKILTFQMSEIFYIWQFVKLFLLLTQRKFTHILNNIKKYELEQTTKIVKENLDQQELFIERKNIVAGLSAQYSIRIVRLMIETIHHLLQFNTHLITVSQFALIQIRQFCENNFVMLCRIYLKEQNHEQIKQGVNQWWNKLMEIAGYFLGKSIQDKNPQLYELSIIVLLTLLHQPKMKKKVQSFPSHFFKHLPITDNNFHEFLFTNILLILSGEKNINNNDQQIIRCNRYHSLRLLLFLIKNQYTTFTNLSIFYLQNICIGTKFDQIQRIYLVKLAMQAIKFKPNSQIFQKTIKNQNISYKLKFKNKTFQLTPSTLASYLQQILPTLPFQTNIYSQRYIYHKIFKKNVLPLWDQSFLWDFVINKSKEKGGLIQIQQTNGLIEKQK